eukprot:gene782-20304_t
MYKAVGTYYNDHSNCWSSLGSADKKHPSSTPSPGNTQTCGGAMPNSPEGSLDKKECEESTGVSSGRCYFVDQ